MTFLKKINNYILFLILFGASLSNHSGFTIIASSILSILLFFKLKEFKKLNRSNLFWLIVTTCFILISSILFLIDFPSYTPDKELEDAFKINIIKYIFLLLLVFTLSSYIFNFTTNTLLSIVNTLIIIHILFFIVQFIIVYVSGYYIDFIEPFTGEKSRYLFYGASTNFNLYRCTGLYVEPSTYAVSIFVLLGIFNALNINKKYKLTYYLSLLTIFLTFSSIGFLLISFYFLFLLIKNKKFILSIVPLLIIFSFTFSDFINIQIEKISSTSGIRVNLVNEILNRPPELLMLGSGLYAIEDHIMQGSRGYCPDNSDCSSSINRLYASPTDSGLLFYLFIKFGLLTPFIILLIIYPFLKNYDNLTSFICVLFTKTQFAFPLFWVMIIIYRRNIK